MGDAPFPGPDWVALLPEAYRDLPPRPGASAVVEVTVTGAPDGDAVFWVELADGRVVASGVGPRADATVTMTAPYAVAAEVATGVVEPSASFMQGRTKVAGDHAALLRVLAVTATPEYRVATARLAERTAV